MKVDFLVDYRSVMNFSMQQNNVAVVNEVTIRNLEDEDIQNLRLKISFDPDFAEEYNYNISCIPSSHEEKLSDIPICISTSFLSGLTEKITGHIKFELFSDNELLCSQTKEISLLPYDLWAGYNVLPEMLVAFVTPNHPAIQPILKRTSEILKNWTQSSSLDEYQTNDPNRVKTQMAALFEAIKEQKIAYHSVPASFINDGQRVRLYDEILGTKAGNCLDMTLLYAGCLEAIGLYPLIIIIKGHAFVGCHLIPDTFPDSVNDDPTLLTKRTAPGINEILLLEATNMNESFQIDFDKASNAANLHLRDYENFELFIDVQRARYAHILPLPLRVVKDGVFVWEEQTKNKHNYHAPKKLSPTDIIPNQEDSTVSKQVIWERKLLDLSLRNNLLNMRITKNTLQLLSVNIESLEDSLADGQEFQVFPKPKDWDNPLLNNGIYQKLNASDPIFDLLSSELKQKRLRSYLGEEELKRSLTHLYRSSKLSLEENGANTLYLAIGFLKWYENAKSTRARYAPILLIPIEIIRRSAAKGYVIRRRDEEMMMNITLLEMLRQFFKISINGLDPLPSDESGVDVPLILNTVRHAVMDMPQWDVEELSVIGNFSFSKFIMWNDIHNNSAKLRENKFVDSLITGKLELEQEEISNEKLDDKYPEGKIVLPISADSSQLEAIAAAINGKSFVLHGPPGTGKSQTITNIIANALYNGKKVLFVAEKMAALQVVQKRLESIGLAPFCLELHSNKARKSSVLEQLQRTTEVIKKQENPDFAISAARINEVRKELSDYVSVLHKKYPAGLSLYDCFSYYSSYKAIDETLDKDFLEGLSPEKLSKIEEKVYGLEACSKIIGEYKSHPLKDVQISSFKPSLKNEASAIIASISKGLVKYNEAISLVKNALCLSEYELSRKQINEIRNLCELIVNSRFIPAELIVCNNLCSTIDSIRKVIDYGKKRDSIKESICAQFDEKILELVVVSLRSSYNEAINSWWLSKLIKTSKLRKQFQTFSLTGVKPSVSDLLSIINNIADYQANNDNLTKNSSACKKYFSDVWNEGNCDWELIERACDLVDNLSRIVLDVCADPVAAREIKQKLSGNIFNTNKLQEAVNVIDGINTLYAQLENSLDILDSCSRNWYDSLCTQVDTLGANLDKLHDIATYNASKALVVEAGLGLVVGAVENGDCDLGECSSYFKALLYKSYAEFIIAQEDSLASFHGKLFDEKILRFRQLCSKFENLTREEIYYKLASNLPSLQKEAASTSEVGILQRNIKNGGRGTSIRKLFDQIPYLLPRMCPCMLMSPISVAQYIDAARSPFDLVIFDEASQMPSCEAVGAIARGSSIIVVGDPKQMPPTSFFSANTYDEDNSDIEDLESILDDCLALSIPSKHLLWHYRSKHESLIAFSNIKYYDTHLLTFPSPDDLTTKIQYQYVKGVYDRGRTRQNLEEAKAVIAEIERHLSNPETAKRSIGVVTFNTNQQSLIEDLLNDLFVKHPDLEKVALDCEEPIFVKNLENVQGDERDVILFSVGYGADKDGKLALNFGPLNREGGWRRLNVAVSRARYEMKVFSTLSSDQIDLNRTEARGVRDLKAFLEYAEKGQTVLSYSSNNVHIGNDEFVHTLEKELLDRGYVVKKDVGCSGYRIDLGVVDPNDSNKFVLGILCDGYNYYSAQTVRDREITQIGVLKALGWSVIRVWSMDWWEDRQKVINRLVDAIEKAISGASIDSGSPSVGSASSSGSAGLDVGSSAGAVAGSSVGSVGAGVSFECAPIEPYREAQLSCSTVDLDSLVSGSYKKSFTNKIRTVIDAEAPISKKVLCKKVMNSFGITRLGPRLSNYFDSLFMELNLQQSRIDTDIFYWADNQNPKTYSGYRPVSKREALEIAPEEVANAVYQVLYDQGASPKDALVRQTAHLFNYSRIGDNVLLSMERGINYLIAKGLARSEGDKIILC